MNQCESYSPSSVPDWSGLLGPPSSVSAAANSASSSMTVPTVSTQWSDGQGHGRTLTLPTDAAARTHAAAATPGLVDDGRWSDMMFGERSSASVSGATCSSVPPRTTFADVRPTSSSSSSASAAYQHTHPGSGAEWQQHASHRRADQFGDTTRPGSSTLTTATSPSSSMTSTPNLFPYGYPPPPAPPPSRASASASRPHFDGSDPRISASYGPEVDCARRCQPSASGFNVGLEERSTSVAAAAAAAAVADLATYDQRLFELKSSELSVPPSMDLGGQFPDLKLSSLDDCCPVCGDRVSGYHYGLQTCESCKGFFKRTVQNKKVYSCVDNEDCQVNKSQRKRCPHCRFKKCLSVGMKLEAVRPDRMRGGRNKFGPMYKYDRALRQQAMRQRQLLLAQTYQQGNLCAGFGSRRPGSPADVKPDLSMLSLPSMGPYDDYQQLIPPTSKLPVPSTPSLTSSGTCQSNMDGTFYTEAGTRTFPPHKSSRRPYQQRQHPYPFPFRDHQLPPYDSAGIRPFIGSSTPLAGLSHMMADVPNFVFQNPEPARYQYNYGYSNHHQQMFEARTHNPLEHRHQFHDPQLEKSRQKSLSFTDPSGLGPSADLRMGFPYEDSYKDVSFSGVTRGPSSSQTLSLEVSSAPTENLPPSGTTETTPVQRAPDSSSVNALPILMTDLQHSEPSEEDVQKKLSSILVMMLERQQQQRADGTGLKDNHGGCNTGDTASGILSLDSKYSKQLDVAIELVCKMCDHVLFMLVEWARSARYFKELKVDTQMKLLQNSWSELLMLNILYLQTCHDHADALLMMTGDMVPIDVLNIVGMANVKDRLRDLVRKVRELRLDRTEYICLKYIVLLNPDVSGLDRPEFVERIQEQINSILMEYCSTTYADVHDKFGRLLVLLHEVRLLSMCAEEFLYAQHVAGLISDNTLLMEMLHSRQT